MKLKHVKIFVLLMLSILLSLVCISIVSADAINESIQIKLDEEKAVSGITILFKAVASKSELMFTLNGKTAFLTKGKMQRVSGVELTVTQVLEAKDGTTAWLTVYIPFTCGDAVCEENELSYCCKDCGCATGYECTENVCINEALNQCDKDSDCDTINRCSIGTCEGAPRACVVKPITECKTGDKCCPSVCTEYAKDNDCKQLIECTTKEECDDKNETTNDFCSIPDAKCFHTPLTAKDKEKNDNIKNNTGTTGSGLGSTNNNNNNNTKMLNGTNMSQKESDSLSSSFKSKKSMIMIIVVLVLLIIITLSVIFYIKYKKFKNAGNEGDKNNQNQKIFSGTSSNQSNTNQPGKIDIQLKTGTIDIQLDKEKKLYPINQNVKENNKHKEKIKEHLIKKKHVKPIRNNANSEFGSDVEYDDITYEERHK